MPEEHGTAAEAVFALPELVELIIVQLPPRKIFTVACRVSKMWAATIIRSRRIREKLFLPTTKTLPIAPAQTYEFTPDGFTRRCRYDTQLALNNIMAPHLYRDLGEIFWTVTVDPANAEKAKRAESWRQMFLSDPPITLLHAQGYIFSTNLDELPEKAVDCEMAETEFTVLCRDGITWGGLVDLLMDSCKKYVSGKTKELVIDCCFAEVKSSESDTEIDETSDAEDDGNDGNDGNDHSLLGETN